jgi:hypothetical protein
MRRSPPSFTLLVLALAACGSHNTLFSAATDDASPDAAAAEAATPDAASGEAGLSVDMFDDFEDGDLDVNVAGGRFGHWYNYDDATDGMNQFAVVTLDPTTERHSTLAGVSKMAMRVQSSGYTRWGSGYSADIAEGVTYDLSAYTGIVFWTKNLTDRPVSIKFAVPDTNSDPRGGRCDKSPDAPVETACYDAFAVNVALLPGDWQIHLVPFWQLRQAGFGLKVTTGFPSKEVYSIAVGDDFGSTYDYLLDDVGFYVE